MGIRFDKTQGIFFLTTANSEYQMKIGRFGHLEHLYYGAPVGEMPMDYLQRHLDRGFSGNPYDGSEDRTYSLDTVPQEYTGFDTGDYRIPCLRADAECGVRSTELTYAGHTICAGKELLPHLPGVRAEKDTVDTLEITLGDSATGLTALLRYSVFAEKDCIVRSVVLENRGAQTLTLQKAASVCLELPGSDWDILHFYGKHCMERVRERLEAPHGIFTVSSKRGMSSHHHNPFVILCEKTASERAGNAYGVMLMWSGDHSIEVETDQTESVRLVAGLAEDTFSWTLNPGERFAAPEAILCHSDQGLGLLSQRYHRLLRENVCPGTFRQMDRPVLLNSWEAAYFSFDAETILRLAKDARDLGVQLLVLDDGWFGRRNDDHSSLGDWWENTEKLPGGLAALGEKITALGLSFGLWIEPEMVSEDSDLYRAHPDWAVREPDRKPMVARSQLVLDLTRSDVRDYLFARISELLTNAPISYLKWDFNRGISNRFSHALPAKSQGEFSTRYVLGVYDLLERVTQAFPDVMIEGCAGGGGRFDAGMLYYCPQIWCSDDTDPIMRCAIQEGTSYGYPIGAVGSHVSASPNHQTGRATPFSTRAAVAMAGTFGYELNPAHLSEEEKEQVKTQIAFYHRVAPLIRKGTYYRLSEDAKDGQFSAWQLVSEDQSQSLVTLVIEKTLANPPIPQVHLQGLIADGRYRMEGSERVFTGAALMHGGYALTPGRDLPMEDYASVQLLFTLV